MTQTFHFIFSLQFHGFTTLFPHVHIHARTHMHSHTHIHTHTYTHTTPWVNLTHNFTTLEFQLTNYTFFRGRRNNATLQGVLLRDAMAQAQEIAEPPLDRALRVLEGGYGSLRGHGIGDVGSHAIPNLGWIRHCDDQVKGVSIFVFFLFFLSLLLQQ